MFRLALLSSSERSRATGEHVASNLLFRLLFRHQSFSLSTSDLRPACTFPVTLLSMNDSTYCTHILIKPKTCLWLVCATSRLLPDPPSQHEDDIFGVPEFASEADVQHADFRVTSSNVFHRGSVTEIFRARKNKMSIVVIRSLPSCRAPANTASSLASCQ